MGDGTKENPYTRKDVLRLIEENGGTAKGLNLSEKIFIERIDLSDLDLSGIKLTKSRLFRAIFDGSILDGASMENTYLGYATFNPLKSKAAHLQGINLRGANLHNAEFRGADLTGAQFQGVPIILSDQSQAAQFQGTLWEILPARLEETDFRGANLFLANFKGCYFYGTKFEGAFIRGADIFETHLEEVDWGNYKIGEENKKDFYSAVHYYRHLKMWYTQKGYHDIAGEFFYRETEAKRKELIYFKRRFWYRFVLGWSRWIFGHGERWKRLCFGWIPAVVLLFTLCYFVGGAVWEWPALWNALYFSAVSFTALGYGNWVSESTDWVKGLGAFEAFIGIFMIALLLVTIVRKMTR